jgi:3-oxoacyl-[acyl-carrier-protein] synthase II
MDGALRDAGLERNDIGFISAQGLGTIRDDQVEAAAISQVFDNTPVTAPKSFFGSLGAAAGAVEAVAAIQAIVQREVPVTLNYEHPDPACPINVVHGKPLPLDRPVCMLVSYTQIGQAATLIMAGP